MDTNQQKIDKYYNKVTPRYQLESLSLDPVSGVLGKNRARHLLSRCLFGFNAEDLMQVRTLTITEAINLLLEPLEPANPPLGIDNRDEDTFVGETWVNNAYNSNYNNYRLISLYNWWTGLMLDQPVSLREKMVMFWHNHFVTESSVVKRSDLLYRYNDCLRRNALGNFKKLTEEITILPAMLKYLDGDENSATAPNENYARELLELFTIGKGAQIAEGNYTNYTETDVREAARVLTGWRIDFENNAGVFKANKHDTGTKTFSQAFGNAQISNQGDEEYKSLIAMIFDQDETARFIIRKLYRWFVYYVIDDEIETNIIEPLATELRNNNYEISSVLEKLLSSEHFFDESFRGCVIKNPLDLILGTVKNINFPVPDSGYLLDQYDVWRYFFTQAGKLEMQPGSPPDVAGWPAYYLSPQFHQLWVNAATIPQKAAITDGITSSAGIQVNGNKYVADLIAVAETTSKPEDVNILIEELAFRFFPQEISQNQKDDLKSVLLSGLPDFEWTNEWQAYQGNEDDEAQRMALENKLRGLFQTMFRMAEYQLS